MLIRRSIIPRLCSALEEFLSSKKQVEKSHGENQIGLEWSARDAFIGKLLLRGVAAKREGEIVNSRRDKNENEFEHGAGEEIIAHTNRS